MLLLSLSGVVLSFIQAEYTVYEDAGIVTDLFCCELCSGSPKRDFSFYIDYDNGSAISNELSLSLSFSLSLSLSTTSFKYSMQCI